MGNNIIKNAIRSFLDKSSFDKRNGELVVKHNDLEIIYVGFQNANYNFGDCLKHRYVFEVKLPNVVKTMEIHKNINNEDLDYLLNSKLQGC